jgi:hypothetical protein
MDGHLVRVWVGGGSVGEWATGKGRGGVGMSL